jgi:hypothetical protein
MDNNEHDHHRAENHADASSDEQPISNWLFLRKLFYAGCGFWSTLPQHLHQHPDQECEANNNERQDNLPDDFDDLYE